MSAPVCGSSTLMRRASEAEDAAGGADQVGGGDGAVDIVLRAFDGRGDVVAEGEFCGEGGGERAVYFAKLRGTN